MSCGSSESSPISDRNKKRAAPQKGPARLRAEVSTSVGDEDRFDLGLDLLFRLRAGDGDLLHDQGSCGVEHAPLAEGQLLIRLQAIEVTKNLRDVVDGSRLDLVHEPAIAAVPRLVVERDGSL